MAKYIDGDESGEMTTSETSDRLDDSIRSLAGGHLARFVPIDIFCPLCPLWCCTPDLAAMAEYFDGDASGEMTTSETSDCLVEAIKCLAGGNLARCFPIEISQAIWQPARLPLPWVQNSREKPGGFLRREKLLLGEKNPLPSFVPNGRKTQKGRKPETQSRFQGFFARAENSQVEKPKLKVGPKNM